MYHLSKTSESYIEIKKSKFFGYLIPVTSEVQAKEELLKLKKLYPDARHHCYGLICGDIQRSNDDGEPSGTAGMPILECLRHANLDQCLAVVVRYFGGTLLGANNLGKAYRQCVEQAIASAVKTQPVEMMVCTIDVPYDLMSKAEHILEAATIENRDYGEVITYQYCCQQSLSEAFTIATNGKCSPIQIGTKIIEKEL